MTFAEMTGEVREAVGRLAASEHEDVGGRILRKWRMPRAIVDVAGSHHAPFARPDESLDHRRAIVEMAWGTAVRETGEYLPHLHAPPPGQPAPQG